MVIRHQASSISQLTPAELRELIYRTGLRRCDLCEMLGFSERTVSRWYSGSGKPSKPVLRLLHIIAYGLEYLPGAGKEWRNWYFANGRLHDHDAPKREFHTPSSIDAWWWLSQELALLRAQENFKKTGRKYYNIIFFPLKSANYLTSILYGKIRNKKIR